MWFDTILWLVAVVAFIMVEAATTALVSVWFAVGAAAAMLGSFFNVGFGWQMLVDIAPGLPGRVRVDGLDWQARAEVTLPQGTRCKVVAVDGAILIVAPVTADAAAV